MYGIYGIFRKDLLQFVRDGKTFLFLLAMPVAFTLLFGYAFGEFGKGETDERLAVGLLDQDNQGLSQELIRRLQASQVIRLVEEPQASVTSLEEAVVAKDLSAAIIIPAGYSEALKNNSPQPVQLIALDDSSTRVSILGDVQSAAGFIARSARTARAVSTAGGSLDFDRALEMVLAAWQKPPVVIESSTSAATENTGGQSLGLGHSSPAMMLQFAIAGLLTAATVLVNERKTRSLQRLLTTATSRMQILLGHYLAIFTTIFIQFGLLIAFGQIFLKVDYLHQPLATLVVAIGAALCIAAMGLLIGVLAKSDEQAIIFSLLPMFLLSALGGAWTPLELTSPSFQAVGHLSPVAWAMDGFKNIAVRGLDFQSVLLPTAALLGYTVLFFALAAWRLTASEEHA